MLSRSSLKRVTSLSSLASSAPVSLLCESTLTAQREVATLNGEPSAVLEPGNTVQSSSRFSSGLGEAEKMGRYNKSSLAAPERCC